MSEEETFHEALLREFPQLEIDCNASVSAFHIAAARAFLSELRALGVDAELTRCWAERYDSFCEVTLSGQSIGSIVLADWDGVCRTEFRVPDMRSPSSVRKVWKIRLSSVHRKTFPVFGRVRDVVWEGADLGFGLVDDLNGSQQFKKALLHKGHHEIWLDKRLGWILSVDGWQPPTGDVWGCYLSIATYLRSVRLPSY